MWRSSPSTRLESGVDELQRSRAFSHGPDLVAAIGAKLASVRAIDCHLEEFERAFRGRVDALRQAHLERAPLLADLGLWLVAAPSDDAAAEGDPPK